jgi:hypothetical protein
VAASLLQARGAAEAIHVVDGGVPRWGELGHALEGSQEAAATPA